jgi:hypothetical protein
MPTFLQHSCMLELDHLFWIFRYQASHFHHIFSSTKDYNLLHLFKPPENLKHFFLKQECFVKMLKLANLSEEVWTIQVTLHQLSQ